MTETERLTQLKRTLAIISQYADDQELIELDDYLLPHQLQHLELQISTYEGLMMLNLNADELRSQILTPLPALAMGDDTTFTLDQGILGLIDDNARDYSPE